MPAVLSGEDRRKTPRIDVGNLVAYIDLHDGDAPRLICVWNLSLGGACLLVPPETIIPDEFDLLIDGATHPVKTIWRRQPYVGVQLRLEKAQ